MFVIPKENGFICFNKYLCRIVIDYLKLNGTLLYEQAVEALESAVLEGGIGHVQIEKRKYTSECNCVKEYQMMRPGTLQKFFGPSYN